MTRLVHLSSFSIVDRNYNQDSLIIKRIISFSSRILQVYIVVKVVLM